MLKVIRKFVPESIYERVRAAIIFRPEDPNNLSQVVPQRTVNVPVERIKGYRYPAPGSRVGASVPQRESEDQVYDDQYFARDPNLLVREESYSINGTKPVHISLDMPRPVSHGKRKITLLPYDASGLRTTKTVTWEAVDKVLAKNAAPDHLIHPAWWAERAALEADREAKGLPPPIGRAMSFTNTQNANRVVW